MIHASISPYQSAAEKKAGRRLTRRREGGREEEQRAEGDRAWKKYILYTRWRRRIDYPVFRRRYSLRVIRRAAPFSDHFALVFISIGKIDESASAKRREDVTEILNSLCFGLHPKQIGIYGRRARCIRRRSMPLPRPFHVLSLTGFLDRCKADFSDEEISARLPCFSSATSNASKFEHLAG